MPQGDSYNNLTAGTIADDDEFVVFDDPAGSTDTKNITAGEYRDYVEAGATVAGLVTLSGVDAESENLGEFTGSTITDNVTVKAALQELETAVEGVSGGSADTITDGESSATKVDAGDSTAATVTTTVAGDVIDELGQYTRTFLQGTNATGANSRELHIQHGEGVGIAAAPRDGMFFAATTPGDSLPPGDASDRFASLHFGSTTVNGHGVEVIVGNGNLSTTVTARFEIDSSGDPSLAFAAGANALLIDNERTRITGPAHLTNVGSTVSDTTLTLTAAHDGLHIPLDTSSNSIEVAIPDSLETGFTCSFRKTSGSNSVTFNTDSGNITPTFYGQNTATAQHTLISLIVESDSVALVTIVESV